MSEMFSDVNVVLISGTIVSDIKASAMKNGKECYTFFLENKGVFGTFVQRNNFRCTCFSSYLVSKLGNLNKGARIMVQGRLNSYTPKKDNGTYGDAIVSINVSNIEVPSATQSSGTVEGFVKEEGLQANKIVNNSQPSASQPESAPF